MSEHHIIVVGDVDPESGLPDWSIEHPPECPQGEPYFPGVVDYTCTVGNEISTNGLAAFSTWDEWPEDVPKVPGRYPIEAWQEEYYSHSYGSVEYDRGLRMKETEPLS